MKSKPTRHRLRRACAAICFTASLPAAFAQVSVDGVRAAGEGYTEQAVQAFASNWGVNQTLANLHTFQDGVSLGILMAGRVQGNAFILFIDSKAGGVTKITNNLITSGGEEFTINNLGNSSTQGLTFENGFNPDYAVRIYGDGAGTAAHINRYNLQTGARSYVGQAVANTPAASGFVSQASVVWKDVTGTNLEATDGAEIKLNLAALGVPFGNQPVKLMAILVNDNSSFGSNQVLASKSASSDLESAINSFNFETEAGIQTISLTVMNNDTDGDGTPNNLDADDDGDGLLDTYETSTGIYVSAIDTGTDPLIIDTDEDGVSDGDEVMNNGFGFLSNPNIANYTSIAIPGNFTTPPWQENGSAGNRMTMVDTSLTGQYQWFLDYKFGVVGSIAYKFAANGSWTQNWGDNGNDITATIAATGFHRFTFDNSTLSRLLTRTTYPDVAAYLAAYGLSDTPSGDADSDNVSNQNEFLANADPTNSDTDGDGISDNVDPTPLVEGPGTYKSWKVANAGGQSAIEDFDGDGMANGVEFFMGNTGSSFTANPTSVNGTITWPRDASTTGVTFRILASENLASWTDVTASTDTSDPNFVKYTLPTGNSKHFTRLEVTVP